MPEFNEDFAKISKGCERDILKKLAFYIPILANSSPSELVKHNQIEPLKHQGKRSLWSLHIETQERNLRLLFVIQEDGKLLLTAFDEKAGKRATSYDKYAEIALQRYDKYKGGI